MNIPAWQHGLPDWTPLPNLEGSVSTDVCVIGLGGSGLSAVNALLEHGVDVVGVDAGTVAGAAAGRNGGLILAGNAAFYHDAVRDLGKEPALDWYRATQAEVDRMIEQTPEHTARPGSLRIADSDEELTDCIEQFNVMQRDGLPVEQYDGPEGQGLLFPNDATYNPLARNRSRARTAIKYGARLYERSPVSHIEHGLVRTNAGEVRAKAVLVAVDGNLARLIPELEGDVRPLRLQMLGTAPLSEKRYSRPVYSRWGFEYWQQLADGRLVIGGFRDKGGDGEWDAEPHPTNPVQSELTSFVRSTLGIDAKITHRWAATVGYRKEILPYHGQVRAGVWALGGYNGTGNVVGSLLGARLANEIAKSL